MVRKTLGAVIALIIFGGFVFATATGCGGGNVVQPVDEPAETSSFEVIDGARVAANRAVTCPTVPVIILTGADAVAGSFVLQGGDDGPAIECSSWLDKNTLNNTSQVVVHPARFAPRLIAGKSYRLVRDDEFVVGPELVADAGGKVGRELSECVGLGVFHYPLSDMQLYPDEWSGDVVVAYFQDAIVTPTLTLRGPVDLIGEDWQRSAKIKIGNDNLSVYRRRIDNVVDGRYEAVFTANIQDSWFWQVGSTDRFDNARYYITNSSGVVEEFVPARGAHIPRNGLIVVDQGGMLGSRLETAGDQAIRFRDIDVNLGPTNNTTVFQAVKPVEGGFGEYTHTLLDVGAVYRFSNFDQFADVLFRVEVVDELIGWPDLLIYQAGLAPSAPFYMSVDVPTDATLFVRKGVYAGETTLELQDKEYHTVPAVITDVGDHYEIAPSVPLAADKDYRIVTSNPAEWVAPFRTLPLP